MFIALDSVCSFIHSLSLSFSKTEENRLAKRVILKMKYNLDALNRQNSSLWGYSSSTLPVQLRSIYKS
jgi:hypothetical protein